MEKLAKVLVELMEEYSPNEKFDWEVPANCPIPIPTELTTNFEKNVYLKRNLAPVLTQKQLPNRYWVIREWGGIKSLKQNEKNDNLLKGFDLVLENGEMTRSTFSIISSLSKVASFLDHENYAIYDSRVIYALNWLLFKHENTLEFFPQPSSRNKELARFELNTLFNLFQRDIQYISHKHAYFLYCKLLRSLAERVFGKREPYLVEMLLFIIAPTYIVEDIRFSVLVSMKK